MGTLNSYSPSFAFTTMLPSEVYLAVPLVIMFERRVAAALLVFAINSAS